MRVYAMEHAPNVARPDTIGHHLGALAEFWGRKKVSEIKGSTCRAYAKTRTQSMARHELETLRAAVNYFHKEYGLDPLPAFTMPPKSRPRERWLTRDEAASLLRSARRTPHLARFILIGLYTGTRSGAILGLSWLPSVTAGYVDLDAGVMHRSGAGQRQSKKRQPPVAIPARLLAHMKRWRLMDGNGSQRTLIRSVIHWNGGRVDSVKKAFRSARENASISNDVTPHTLRHSCVTWLMQAGVDIWQVAGFVGMTVEMVQRNYGHHHPAFQKQAADAVTRRRA
jgi:integrase